MSDSVSQPAETAITTRGLSRSFESVLAVDDLTIQVATGTIYGFLGPNGAGKTTTIRLLLGLLEPSSGGASVLGYDVGSDSQQIRERAGVLLETDGLYTRLTALQNLDYFGRIARLPASDRARRIRDLLTAMNLWERRDGRVADFSKGMRQKLALARAFLHHPKLLFLDEPTSGLDTPSAVALRRELVKLAREEGVTVFLTTHNLLEAEKVCDTVAVIRRGRLLVEGSPAEIHGSRSRRVVITVRGLNDELVGRIGALPFVTSAVFEGRAEDGNGSAAEAGELTVDLAPGSDAAPVVRTLVEGGAEVAAVDTARESLEEIFLKLVEEGESEDSVP